jgi:hypothetical protein
MKDTFELVVEADEAVLGWRLAGYWLSLRGTDQVICAYGFAI